MTVKKFTSPTGWFSLKLPTNWGYLLVFLMMGISCRGDWQIAQAVAVGSDQTRQCLHQPGQSRKLSGLPLLSCIVHYAQRFVYSRASSPCFSTMKRLTVYLIFLVSTLCFGQTKSGQHQSSPKLKVVFSMYNHAERIFNGVTLYTLTDSLIEVKKQYLFDKKSKVVYSGIVPNLNQLVSAFKQIPWNLLETSYFNECVMITSGDEYVVELQQESTQKRVSLHHYYVKEIAEAVKLINSTLPDQYHFEYVSKETEQNCK